MTHIGSQLENNLSIHNTKHKTLSHLFSHRHHSFRHHLWTKFKNPNFPIHRHFYPNITKSTSTVQLRRPFPLTCYIFIIRFGLKLSKFPHQLCHTPSRVHSCKQCIFHYVFMYCYFQPEPVKRILARPFGGLTSTQLTLGPGSKYIYVCYL